MAGATAAAVPVHSCISSFTSIQSVGLFILSLSLSLSPSFQHESFAATLDDRHMCQSVSQRASAVNKLISSRLVESGEGCRG